MEKATSSQSTIVRMMPFVEAIRSGVDLAWEKRGCVTPSLSLLGKGGGIFVGGLQYPSKLRQYDFFVHS